MLMLFVSACVNIKLFANLSKLGLRVVQLVSEVSLLPPSGHKINCCSFHSGLSSWIRHDTRHPASEGCDHSPSMESHVVGIVWLCLCVRLFLMCALSFFEIGASDPGSSVMGGRWTECFHSLEWDAFKYSFDVTNCIFDTQAHPNE